MPVLREAIEVGQSVQEAFDAVADFSTSASWDPGVVSAERIREGQGAPSGVGAVYRLVVTFKGRESEMTYRTTEYEAPARIVLEGIGPKIAAVDTIEFAARDGGGTRISYEADLRLLGLAKAAEPFLGGEFDAMGKRALQGMKSWFAEGPAHAER